MRSKLAYRPEEPPGEENCEETKGALTDLAMELMRRVGAAPQQPQQPIANGEDVLMDVESDGIRCVLVRTATHAADAPLLSPRELEIARMVARGLPNKTIAAVLEISTWTVGTYLRRMFAKLGVTSRAAMVAKLMQR